MSLPESPAEQVERIQSAYRQRLVDSWPIEDGARVLEIGCGQGDMTAVIARAVGPLGHVLAVDIADSAYGAPQTLREATDHLLSSEMGSRMKFLFEFDILNPPNDFAPDPFDWVVMVHSSWYFTTVDQLERTLRQLLRWRQKLCFVEWDLNPRSFDQVPHMLAALIQGQVEAYKKKSIANIRTPLAKNQMLEILERNGWRPASIGKIETDELQDARWEIAATLANSAGEALALGLPEKIQHLLAGQLEVLRLLSAPGNFLPLDAYAVIGERDHPK
jgi:SAM-dependent methyltransferase